MRTRQFSDGIYILKPQVYKTEKGALKAALAIERRSHVQARTYYNKSKGTFEVLWKPDKGNWIGR